VQQRRAEFTLIADALDANLPLKSEDDPQKLQATVLSWLKKTVAKLEEEVAVGK
jgi:hypothetical protein